jgi:hypothetical protein
MTGCHDYKLPPELGPEELRSSAVHPLVHILVLDNDQGYPRSINVRASEEGSDVGITVEDVVRAISTDLQASSNQREWAALNEDRCREVEETFKNRSFRFLRMTRPCNLYTLLALCRFIWCLILFCLLTS